MCLHYKCLRRAHWHSICTVLYTHSSHYAHLFLFSSSLVVCWSFMFPCIWVSHIHQPDLLPYCSFKDSFHPPLLLVCAVTPLCVMLFCYVWHATLLCFHVILCQSVFLFSVTLVLFRYMCLVCLNIVSL